MTMTSPAQSGRAAEPVSSRWKQADVLWDVAAGLFPTSLSRSGLFWKRVSHLPVEEFCGCLSSVWKISPALEVMLRPRHQPGEGCPGGAERLEKKQTGHKDSACEKITALGRGRATRMAWRELGTGEGHKLWGSGSLGCRRWWGGEARGGGTLASNAGKLPKHQVFSGDQSIISAVL